MRHDDVRDDVPVPDAQEQLIDADHLAPEDDEEVSVSGSSAPPLEATDADWLEQSTVVRETEDDPVRDR